jgi:hypothetical protein
MLRRRFDGPDCGYAAPAVRNGVAGAHGPAGFRCAAGVHNPAGLRRVTTNHFFLFLLLSVCFLLVAPAAEQGRFAFRLRTSEWVGRAGFFYNSPLIKILVLKF